MFSIQEIVKQTGISSRMLRYYDEKGLLKPVYRSESGIRYYDESSIGKLNLISTLLFLNYSVEDVSTMLNDVSFSTDSALAVLKKQEDELRLQRQKINKWLYILDRLQKDDTSQFTSWDAVARSIHKIMFEKQVVETHKSGTGRYVGNFWRNHGSNIDEWLQWMFEPVKFSDVSMRMAEVNASRPDYWLHNIGRLPSGQLDLFYDPTVRIGSEIIDKENLKTAWLDMKSLQDVPAETYDLIFNDHLHFYRDDFTTGIDEMIRVLKQGGKLYVTLEDPTHNATMRQWTHYLEPSRKFVPAWYKEHFAPDKLLELFESKFTSVIDYPRFDSVKVTDETELVEHIRERCHVSDSDETAKLRFLKVKKDIHTLFKKQGFVEIESRYHIIEAIK